jgi:hypothetical protein
MSHVTTTPFTKPPPPAQELLIEQPQMLTKRLKFEQFILRFPRRYGSRRARS